MDFDKPRVALESPGDLLWSRVGLEPDSTILKSPNLQCPPLLYIRHAAFAGATCAVVPRMLPRKIGGASFVGYMPQLEGVLGVGSFDAGCSARRPGGALRRSCARGAASDSSSARAGRP